MMASKRNRSVNWDEEEKQLFRTVLKDYVHIIENKCLNTNTNKYKIKAWEDVHKKFNALNSRQRNLSQLKVQWKAMKISARKTYSTYKSDIIKTGGGSRPATPDESVMQVKDLMNPAELLRDFNPYDSDGLVQISLPNEEMASTSGTCAVTSLNDTNTMSYEVNCLLDDDTDKENQQDHNIIIIDEIDEPGQIDAQKCTPIVNSEEDILTASPLKTTAKVKGKVLKRKFINKNTPGSVSNIRKDHDYVTAMISYSKELKNEEHKRRMEMVEEKHTIEMKIQQEKLKCVILEREILELRKKHEED